MSPRLNSSKSICLTVRGLVITNAECHFQFQTLHSVTNTNIESKDTSLQYISSLAFYLRLKIPKESSAQKDTAHCTCADIFIYF